MPAKKKKKRIFKLIGIILIIFGAGFLLYIPATYLIGYFEQRSLHGEFDEQSAVALSLNQSVLEKLHGAAETEKIRNLSQAFKDQLSSGQTIAQLEIPKIGLNVIVVEGADDSSLKKGPGHEPSTPLPGMGGNFAVAGDRVLYGAPFFNIDELSTGDEINLKTQYASFKYTVADKHQTYPEDTTILEQNAGEAITLITCDPPWGTSRRLVVLGKMVSDNLLQAS